MAKQWEFYHTTSSPYHHQSNGKAESAVKIAKRLLKKATQDKKDINLTILEWRNTPTEGGPYSPVQKLQSRRTRTLLPTSKQLLDPEIATNVEEGIQLRKKAAKQQHDRGAKQLPPLSSGQIVRVQPINHGEKWKKATILKQVGERSYLVKTLNGHIYRRNRKFIRATKEGMKPDDSSSKDAEDELYVPITEEQETPANQTDNPTGQESNPTLTQTCPENSTSETITRTGQVVKPLLKYRDFVKQ